MKTLGNRLESLKRAWQQRHPVKWPPLKIVALAGEKPTPDEQRRIRALETGGYRVLEIVVVPAVSGERGKHKGR